MTRWRSGAWTGPAVVAGGALVVIGAFLPWVSISAGGDLGGMDFGDGIWAVAVGLFTAVAGLLMIAAPTGGKRRLGIASAVLSLVLGAYDISELQGAIESAAGANIGIGLWAVVLGGVIALVGAIAARTPAAPVAAR